ncbi:MAG TPA: 50S ribosomal protein L15 [Patescibacteria group bacterium]|nr:50S ribosomal protein L15 [Patescibacteria group bacterium]
MQNDLQKLVKPRHKRVGRGGGSGKGFHTAGRGQKGQKTRRTINVLFEGYKVKKSLLRRLPMQRGRSKFKANDKPLIINLEVLNLMKDGETVTIETLAKAGIVDIKDAKRFGVKILGKGELKKKLKIELPMSKSVAKRINA